MSYRLNTQVKPLIWVEAVVEPHSHSRIEYMIKTKSQFKSRSIANNVEIIIPVPRDVDSPSFKASIGNATSCAIATVLLIYIYLSCDRHRHLLPGQGCHSLVNQAIQWN